MELLTSTTAASPDELQDAELQNAEPDVERIAGVSLADFAQIIATLADYNFDQSRAVGIAAERGIAAADYETAAAVWNLRIDTDVALARQFNRYYAQP